MPITDLLVVDVIQLLHLYWRCNLIFLLFWHVSVVLVSFLLARECLLDLAIALPCHYGAAGFLYVIPVGHRCFGCFVVLSSFLCMFVLWLFFICHYHAGEYCASI